MHLQCRTIRDGHRGVPRLGSFRTEFRSRRGSDYHEDMNAERAAVVRLQHQVRRERRVVAVTDLAILRRSSEACR
jgi:hypothetical protein